MCSWEFANHFQTTLIMNLVYTCEGMGEKTECGIHFICQGQHSLLNSPLHGEWDPNSNNDDEKVKCFLCNQNCVAQKKVKVNLPLSTIGTSSVGLIPRGWQKSRSRFSQRKSQLGSNHNFCFPMVLFTILLGVPGHSVTKAIKLKQNNTSIY